jgi:hypothetical protein
MTKRLSATLALDKIKKIHEWEGCSESSAMFKNNDPMTDKTPMINMGLGVNAESMSLRKEFYSNAVNAQSMSLRKEVYSKEQKEIHSHRNKTDGHASRVTPMLQTQIPLSKLVFNLVVRKMRAFWCPEGKKPMCVVLDFIMITNKIDNNIQYSKRVWYSLRQQYSWGSINGYDVMDIDGLKTLLKSLPQSHWIAKHNAIPFRSDIDSALKAFENGDTSMIENATWSDDEPVNAMSVPINTTNRQAATTASVSYPGVLPLGACPVLHQTYTMSKIDKIRANMNGYGASAGSSGASVSSAPSDALAIQVRFLI